MEKIVIDKPVRNKFFKPSKHNEDQDQTEANNDTDSVEKISNESLSGENDIKKKKIDVPNDILS